MDLYYNKYFKVWIEFVIDFLWFDLRDKFGRIRSDFWFRIFFFVYNFGNCFIIKLGILFKIKVFIFINKDKKEIR